MEFHQEAEMPVDEPQQPVLNQEQESVMLMEELEREISDCHCPQEERPPGHQE